MAGSISATTAALITAGVAAAGVGTSLYMGSKQEDVQKKALQQQRQAQTQAEQQALDQQRRSEQAQNAANQKTPDLSAILARAATSGASGVSSTMLTGPGGVSTGGLNLGGKTLLGS
jgi:uncharacterized protein HemX